MTVLDCFKMPKPVTITGRISSVTNSFANGIIPVIHPSEEEVEEALRILNLHAEDLRCAYCGDPSTEWDHLRPLIMDKQPTGYISEIANLVPACGKCNQSKGNKNWRSWMLSSAKLSPTSRNIPDIDKKISRLEAYENWHNVQPIDLVKLAGADDWNAYWQSRQIVIDAMRDSQKLADAIKANISANYQQR